MEQEMWYKNPYILLKNYQDFFPKNEMNDIQKLNAIARLAIYYGILIAVFGLDTKWISISLCLLILTYVLAKTEHFTKLQNEQCTRPTKDNPFMNFTVGDLINNPQRTEACKNEDVVDETKKMFRSNNMFLDTNDLWGQNINDRNFYTMPSTQIVNNQKGFGNFVFGDFGKCKSEGKDCLKHRDNRFHRGRYDRQY